MYDRVCAKSHTKSIDEKNLPRVESRRTTFEPELHLRIHMEEAKPLPPAAASLCIVAAGWQRAFLPRSFPCRQQLPDLADLVSGWVVIGAPGRLYTFDRVCAKSHTKSIDEKNLPRAESRRATFLPNVYLRIHKGRRSCCNVGFPQGI